eukprot:523439-Pelagomonas_calceolata.AAC.3
MGRTRLKAIGPGTHKVVSNNSLYIILDNQTQLHRTHAPVLSVLSSGKYPSKIACILHPSRLPSNSACRIAQSKLVPNLCLWIHLRALKATTSILAWTQCQTSVFQGADPLVQGPGGNDMQEGDKKCIWALVTKKINSCGEGLQMA